MEARRSLFHQGADTARGVTTTARAPSARALATKAFSRGPEPIILPDTFNDDNIVDAPKTNKLVKLVLLNIDVDVAFKLLIDNVELVDKLFKLLNIVVDVAFKLLIDNIDDVDKLFKLLKVVVDVAFKLLINNLELVEKLFKLLKVVVDVLFKLLIDNIEFVDNEFKLLK